MKKIFSFFVALLFGSIAKTQSVAINTDSSLANPCAILDVKSLTKGILIPRTSASLITNPVKGLLFYDTTLNAFRFYNGTSWTGISNASTTHTIGEVYGGGIVFYVYDNGQHGLIASIADQHPGASWATVYSSTMARAGSANACNGCVPVAGGIGGGKANTALIIADQITLNGARFCNEYSVTMGGITYEDWYLPSIDELHLLYLQKDIVGGFASSNYWSSTEYSTNGAWFQNFSSGLQVRDGNKTTGQPVRAIRAF
jgi:Protein of unknown function (DUF1566)